MHGAASGNLRKLGGGSSVGRGVQRPFKSGLPIGTSLLAASKEALKPSEGSKAPCASEEELLLTGFLRGLIAVGPLKKAGAWGGKRGP